MSRWLPRTATALAAISLALLCAQSAEAVLRVELEWVSTTGSGMPGGSYIFAEPGDRLTLDIFLVIEQPGVVGYSLSVVFDEDFGDELDLVSVTEYEHVADINCMPFPLCFTEFGPELMNATPGVVFAEIESTGVTAGAVEGFEADTAETLGPSDITIRVGRIVFDVTENVAQDRDLEASLLVFGLDGVAFDDETSILPPDLPDDRFVPGIASVPEPGSALLGAVSLATIAALHRRRARQSAWV